MSILDRLKSLFSGGSDDAGVRPAAEPDAATALDDAGVAGMPTSEPQPAEPQAGEPEARPD